MIEGNTNQSIRENTTLSVFTYGQQGSGKTYFGSTFPDPYFIITERTLRGLYLKDKNIPWVKVETYEELERVTNEVIAGTRARGRKSIILDSLSDITPLLTAHVMRQHNKQRMTLELWGIAVDMLRSYMRRLTVELTKNFIVCVTALQSIEKDALTGEVFGGPDTIGRFAQVVPALFDIALYAEQRTEYDPATSKQAAKYYVHSVKQGRFPAKDGIGFLDPTEPNDFNLIYAKFLSKRTS